MLMRKRVGIFFSLSTLLLLLNAPQLTLADEPQESLAHLDQQMVQLKQMVFEQNLKIAQLQGEIQVLQIEKQQINSKVELLMQQVQSFYMRMLNQPLR